MPELRQEGRRGRGLCHGRQDALRRHGLEGTDGLTNLQKEIYEYIREKGKATRAELMENFKLPAPELENQFAILRHCQLLKGKKEGDAVYIVLW
jgi:predicted HTH transcriptional regulator